MSESRWVIMGTLGLAACSGATAKGPDAEATGDDAATSTALPPAVEGTAAATTAPTASAPETASASATTAPAALPAKEQKLGVDLEAVVIDEAHKTITYDANHQGTRSPKHAIFHFDYASFMKHVGAAKKTGHVVLTGVMTPGKPDDENRHFDFVVTALSDKY